MSKIFLSSIFFQNVGYYTESIQKVSKKYPDSIQMLSLYLEQMDSAIKETSIQWDSFSIHLVIQDIDYLCI